MYIFWKFLPRGCTYSPVLKLFTVDANSSLVALGDTHLASAALNLLTGVLGGVYICGKTENEIVISGIVIPWFSFLNDPSLPIILHLQSQIPNLSVLFAQHNLRVGVKELSVELSRTITYDGNERLSNRRNQNYSNAAALQYSWNYKYVFNTKL